MDLERRGRLDDTLTIMMGEFGRSPVINRDARREHWTDVMSLVLAGGGLRHRQVIGSTDRKGHSILDRGVIPQDLAATVFSYLAIPLDAQWYGAEGRPVPIVAAGG